jgi:organic radical activating enzyme
MVRPDEVKTKGYLSEVFVSFQGEGAHVGRRHLFVRLAGCNLRCTYCDTPDSLERTHGYTVWDGECGRTYDNPVSPQELFIIIEEFGHREELIDAVAITGGEPLMQSEFLATALGARNIGIPVLLETNGVLPSKLAAVLPFIDIISMDIKLPSNTGEAEFWSAHEEFLELGKSKDIYVKVVVDETTEPAEVDKAFDLVARCVPEAPAFLQPIVGMSGKTVISASKLADLYRIARHRQATVRVLPQTHKALGIR